MRQIVAAIVGPMRSGTSAVAQVVHYLGLPTGVAIHAPIPPTWRSDWEDFEFAQSLVRLLPLGDFEPSSAQRTAALNYFATYVARRRDWNELLEGATGTTLSGWSLKSPLLALFLEELVAVIADEEDLRLRTLCVTRSDAGIAASWDRTMAKLDGAARTQFGILRALKKHSYTHVVDYDALVKNPKQGVLAIAGALDVNDPEAIERAVAVVRKPTKGAPVCGSQV